MKGGDTFTSKSLDGGGVRVTQKRGKSRFSGIAYSLIIANQSEESFNWWLLVLLTEIASRHLHKSNIFRAYHHMSVRSF